MKERKKEVVSGMERERVERGRERERARGRKRDGVGKRGEG